MVTEKIKQIVGVICRFPNRKDIVDNSIERIINLIELEKINAEIKKINVRTKNTRRVIFNKNKCYNGGDKHNFEARYQRISTKYNYDDNNERVCVSYIYDICTWCGKTIQRIKDESI